MKKLLIAFITISTLFVGCKTKDVAPKPKAEFTYIEDEKGKITFSNKSTDATNYTWDFGDATQEKTKDVSHDYTLNKTYQVSLTAVGDGGTDVIVKSVPVTKVKGSIVFYTSYPASAFVSNPVISIDGLLVGYINKDYSFSTPPECGSSNVLTVGNLSEGEHKLTIQYKNLLNDVGNSTINIKGGTCLKFRIN